MPDIEAQMEDPQAQSVTAILSLGEKRLRLIARAGRAGDALSILDLCPRGGTAVEKKMSGNTRQTSSSAGFCAIAQRDILDITATLQIEADMGESCQEIRRIWTSFLVQKASQ